MFGLMMPPEGNNTTVEDQCFMRVSPQSLKILASSLNAAIDGWEETFGKLPETPAGLSGEKEIVNAVALLKDRVKKLGEAV